MRTGEASRTAEYMALFRALEGCLPAHERLFVDAYAQRFLSAGLRAVREASRLPGVARTVCAFIDRRWPGVRTSAVARTRIIDDRLTAIVGDGANQVLMLGAGFDARAWRLDALAGCRVFEVDHPDTQARKRRKIGDRDGSRVRFVPVDFAKDELGRVLSAHGWSTSVRSAVVWEGVTNYLDAESVDRTLRWFSSCAPGSEIVFTYIHVDVLCRPESFFGTDSVRAVLRSAGEEWRFGLDPRELDAYLAARGLQRIEDIGAAEYRALCWGEHARAMRGYEFYRIARARVVGREAVSSSRSVSGAAGGG